MAAAIVLAHEATVRAAKLKRERDGNAIRLSSSRLEEMWSTSMANTSQTSITRMVLVDPHNHATPTMQGANPHLFE